MTNSLFEVEELHQQRQKETNHLSHKSFGMRETQPLALTSNLAEQELNSRKPQEYKWLIAGLYTSSFLIHSEKKNCQKKRKQKKSEL